MSTSWTKHSQPAFTCSKLTIETLEKGVKNMFKVNIFFTPFSSVSIVNFEHVIAGWAVDNFSK